MGSTKHAEPAIKPAIKPAAEPSVGDADALLDEALADTFPASDPICLQSTFVAGGIDEEGVEVLEDGKILEKPLQSRRSRR
jgi:hypothetical protein